MKLKKKLKVKKYVTPIPVKWTNKPLINDLPN